MPVIGAGAGFLGTLVCNSPYGRLATGCVTIGFAIKAVHDEGMCVAAYAACSKYCDCKAAECGSRLDYGCTYDGPAGTNPPPWRP